MIEQLQRAFYVLLECEKKYLWEGLCDSDDVFLHKLKLVNHHEHVTACFGFDVVKGIIPEKNIFNSGRDVGEEVIRCVLSLFITMAHCHEQVRNVIKTTGGLQLSK